MTGDDGADLSPYEFRVRGHIGPVLLSALPHAVTARRLPRTLVIIEGHDHRDLVEIVELFVSIGLELESIRKYEHQRPGSA